GGALLVAEESLQLVGGASSLLLFLHQRFFSGGGLHLAGMGGQSVVSGSCNSPLSLRRSSPSSRSSRRSHQAPFPLQNAVTLLTRETRKIGLLFHYSIAIGHLGHNLCSFYQSRKKLESAKKERKGSSRIQK